MWWRRIKKITFQMGKENNTNQAYIKRRFNWYQVLCTSVGRSKKPWRTIKVDILVEQSRLWVYQTPLLCRSVTITRFFKYMFRAHTSKTTNQKTLSYDVGVRNRNMYLKVPIPYSHVVWEGENYLFHERFLCNIFNPICFHKVRWFEKVQASYSIYGSCVTHLNLSVFVSAHHQYILQIQHHPLFL
jgi:hypothetical protein